MSHEVHTAIRVCSITGRFGACTINPGILFDNGQRVGAMTDFEMFDFFTLDMTTAKDGGEYILSKEQRDRLACNGQGDLWTIRNKKGHAKVPTLGQDKRSARSIRMDRLAAFYSNVENIQNELSPFND